MYKTRKRDGPMLRAFATRVTRYWKKRSSRIRV